MGQGAPSETEFWKAHPKGGRRPLYESGQQLRDACDEYFAWCQTHPLWEDKVVTVSLGQGEGSAVQHEPVARTRAFTLDGLALFLGCGRSTWDDWRVADWLKEACAYADSVIRTQKFEGAAAGLLNPVIIARDLGLTEKKELTGADGGPIRTEGQTRMVFEVPTDKLVEAIRLINEKY